MRKAPKRLLIVLCGALLCSGAVFAWQRGTALLDGRVYQTSSFVMDTVVDIKFYGANGQSAADALIRQLNLLEGEVSLFREDSDVAKINAAAGSGELVPIGRDTMNLLQNALVLQKASGGMFDVTIAPLSLLWDVTGENPQVPSPEEISAARALVNSRDLLLDRETRSARLLKAGEKIDLGGIAKGLAADKTREVMQQFKITNGYVSLGGTMVVQGGYPSSGEDFVFGIRDPRGGGGEYIATATLRGKIMATTGDYERFFLQDGVRYHHVLDPATGYPAKKGLISVTVISPQGLLSDFLSTALFVGGKDRVLKDFMNDSRFSLVVADEEKNVYLSADLEGVVKPNPGKEKEGYTFTFVQS